MKSEQGRESGGECHVLCRINHGGGRNGKHGKEAM